MNAFLRPLGAIAALILLAACSSGSNAGGIPPLLAPVAPAVLATYPLPAANTIITSMAAGPDGNVWLYEGFANKVARVTPAGMFSEFAIPTANTEGTGITAGPDGNLWLAEDSSKIARITPAGVFTEFLVGAFEQPVGAAFGPDGRVWFADYTPGKVGAMTAAGVVTLYPLPNTSSFPFSIAKGGDGNMWVCARGGTGTIDRVTTAGIVTEFPLPGKEGCNSIAAGADGNVYFTPYNGMHLGKITPSGAITLIAASNFINNLTLGKDGKIYFGIGGGNITLGSVAADGTEKEYALAKTVCALVAGPDSNLWVNDCNNNTIFKVSY